MIDQSMWLSEKEAGKLLEVEEQYLELLRERGYLRPGSHWRSSDEIKQVPWKPKVSYFISGCKEVVEYWKKNENSFDQIAA